ncbi:MAG: GDP-mannose 4,6-dehydratase [Acidimicrobiales bacterium]
MRALVTGVGGFVGHHLVEHLEASGDDVVGCDRADGSLEILEPASVDAAFARSRPEVVYHLAGWSDVGASWDAPLAVFRVNAEGTLNVLDACRRHGVERVLSVSSADVYGVVPPEELPIDEHAPLRPVSPYAASKVAADFLGLQAWLGHHVPVVRVRAFNHIGPGQTPRFVAPALAERIACNERDGSTTVAAGDLSPQRDFTDVRDVVRAYRLLVERGIPGEAYNVCSGSAISVAELAQRMLALASHPMTLVDDVSLRRPVEVPVLRGDGTKLRTATGWAPAITLDATLADLLAEARARFGVDRPGG